MTRRYGLRDDQWGRIEKMLPGREDTVGVTAKDNRLFVEAVLYRYRAGVPWRDLPEYFGKWSSVYRQFRRWTLSGLWDLILDAFNDSGGGNPSLQMIDSTVIRAHHCAAGAKGGLRNRILAVQKVALRPKSISASMQWACP